MKLPPRWKTGYKIVEAVRTGHYCSVVADSRYQLDQVTEAKRGCGPLAVFADLSDAVAYTYYVPLITGLDRALVVECAYAPYRGKRAVWHPLYGPSFPAHESWPGTRYSRKVLPLRVVTPREIVRAVVRAPYEVVCLTERIALVAQRYVDNYRTYCTLVDGWAPPYDSATNQIDCDAGRLRAIFDAEDFQTENNEERTKK